MLSLTLKLLKVTLPHQTLVPMSHVSFRCKYGHPGPLDPIAAAWPHLEWCTACPGRSGGLLGARLGEPALSQQGPSQEACSSRAELMSLRIAGMARRRPCSAVVAHEACNHGQMSVACTCRDDEPMPCFLPR